MSVESIKHPYETRPHIPSKEEAGMEVASPIAQYKGDLDLPLNPVVTRGQDPELFWMNKYGADGTEDRLHVDIRSLYRYEHVSPEVMMKRLYSLKVEQPDDLLFSVNELFGNAVDVDELDKVGEYYQHQDGWTNRMILGDSLLTMTSLLEREGMKGRVQCIYIDPPYGIKYGSNWQVKMNVPKMKDNQPDEEISSEPEQIKAFRDTWELGVHSYLSYIRDRLIISKELLTESGSCFVQISDENVHLIRTIMDEVFGSECFQSELLVKKKGSQKGSYLEAVNDYVLWYSKAPKDSGQARFNAVFEKKELNADTISEYRFIELPDGKIISAIDSESTDGKRIDYRLNPKRLFRDYPQARLFRSNPLTSGGDRKNQSLPFVFEGRTFTPGAGNCWKTTVVTENGKKPGMEVLREQGRLIVGENQLRFKSYLDDFGYQKISNWWDGLGGASDPVYVVQTNTEIIKRCVLMTTNPGDLVLDPTCGSGTTAFVCEWWGRRWISIDTSRIALNIAKTRLITATYPYFTLEDERAKDIRYGFKYTKVNHIMLEDIANEKLVSIETIYDEPLQDKKRLRVSGPFTVETLQSYDPIPASALDDRGEYDERFEKRIFEHLTTAGIRNGARNEQAVFSRIERLSSANLHAAGYFKRLDKGKEHEAKAYFLIGPKFGSVSKRAVNEAAKEARAAGDADWLVILGFAFDSDLDSLTDKRMGTYEISKVRMHDDLLQEGLLKKDKKAATFVTIGEPDIAVHKLDNGFIQIEIRGLDIYDPIKDIVKPRDVNDIAYWMVDDDYDGSSFIVRQVFFCGGDKDEFNKWQKGLDSLVTQKAKKNLEDTLKIEINDEAFERLYGFKSHPIIGETGKAKKIAVRVISQFGEESTKVIDVK